MPTGNNRSVDVTTRNVPRNLLLKKPLEYVRNAVPAVCVVHQQTIAVTNSKDNILNLPDSNGQPENTSCGNILNSAMSSRIASDNPSHGIVFRPMRL